MKKVAQNLIPVVMVLALISFWAGQGHANDIENPVPVMNVGEVSQWEGPVHFVPEDAAGGSDGDPDSAGDGFGLMGDDFLSDILDGNDEIVDGRLELLVQLLYLHLLPQI